MSVPGGSIYRKAGVTNTLLVANFCFENRGWKVIPSLLHVDGWRDAGKGAGHTRIMGLVTNGTWLVSL